MKSKNLNWKSVKIEGTIDGNDLQGFAGLEVLENYDNTLLSNNKGRKRSFAISELDGEILSTSLNKKTKNSDVDNKHVNERAKKKGTTNNYPGKYVLLKTPEQRIENGPFRAAWNKVGIFSEEIIRALVELNFSTPTEIQKLAIPDAAIKRCDILGAAETGSGKTLAFGLPVVQSIHQELQDDPKKMEDLFCLVLTPTRELASQINDHLKEIAKYTDVSIACIIGGLAQVKQERVLNSNPHIVIGTPGRIWEFIESGNQHLQKILHIKHLVIDETDRMIEKGHFAELEKILDAVNNNNRESFKRQIFVFSATLTMLHELPEYVVRRKKKFIAPTEMTKEQKLDTFISLFGMTKPKVVDITSTSAVAKKLIESRILCAIDEKDFYLYYILLNHPGRTIIFCNSIDCVKRNVSVLSHLNITPIFLHGKMEQKQRLRNLEKFQKNDGAIMIATNCAARGLDIPNVQHVIHYQVPTTGEDYVHRSGRTARATKEGLSILLMEPNEVKQFVKLQKTLGRNEDIPLFPTDTRIMRLVKERVRLAREIESLDFQLRRSKNNKNWRKTAADNIGILDSDDSDDESRSNRNLKQINMVIRQKKLALGKLLASSLMPSRNIQSLKYPIGNTITSVFEQDSLSLVKNVTQGLSGAKNVRRIKLFKKKY